MIKIDLSFNIHSMNQRYYLLIKIKTEKLIFLSQNTQQPKCQGKKNPAHTLRHGQKTSKYFRNLR